MSIPQFPARKLAELVLGYLAEEQLMTLYDEFLQASPYLDIHRNDYDITILLMTPLRSILADYAAVKVCVASCKPFALRKRLQCTNLLEVFKFLIANVDLKKINQTHDKSSVEKQHVTTPKPVCELCQALSLPGCVCKRISEPHKPALQTSVEATPLDELPGNYAARMKLVKVLEKSNSQSTSSVSSGQDNVSATQAGSSHISPEEYLARCENSPVVKSGHTSWNVTVKAADPENTSTNIEEFNNVLKSVVTRNKKLSCSDKISHQRISNAGTIQDFTSGVIGGTRSATYNVPDSSTSETMNVRATTRRPVYNDDAKDPPQQLMLQVSQVNDIIAMTSTKTPILPKPLTKTLPRTQEKQIKVISDIKVDSQIKKKFIPATSTPVMNVQAIMVDGTQAYSNTSNTHTFTMNEIMAMPTYIVGPTSESSQVPTIVHANPIITPDMNEVPDENVAGNCCTNLLGPLVIDVPSHTDTTSLAGVLPNLSDVAPPTSNLIKTVDSVDVKTSTGTTASVTKDNVIAAENNTPQVLPPMRKSSSTPRRTSHVRVLHFTSPRRILHETNEVPVPSSEAPAEVVVSGSHSTETAETSESETKLIPSVLAKEVQVEKANDSGSAKENESEIKPVKLSKKSNWDADLRALVANDTFPEVSHRKNKTKATNKSKTIEKEPPVKEKKKYRKQSPRVKKSTENKEKIESLPEVNTSSERSSKLNIKIIHCDKKSKTDSIGAKNKSSEKVDECIETPETERLSLQNVIGAKLNISDFFETPYKQALYDIQMETPKCLGPDLPDIPLSNVKITDIPTPRFFNTPIPTIATPSSYCSRPTDYSSGGSYYKPDDQDYLPPPELLACTATSSKQDVSQEKMDDKSSHARKSRPVRTCAKNVSYCNNMGAGKNKQVDDENVDADSTCSESANSSFKVKNKKDTPVAKKPRTRTQTNKSDPKKKVTLSKKNNFSKEPVVDDKSKSFIKIKMKKYTPVKSKKQMISPFSKASSSVPTRKRTTSKDKKLMNTVALMVPAVTKSRRKSTTPRKLQCAKPFEAERCTHDVSSTKPNSNAGISNTSHDSEAEQIKLRWSDEGSQDAKSKDRPVEKTGNETEDLRKIQQFIVSTGESQSERLTDTTLQRNLMERGFDPETAKSIERDLLDDALVRPEPSKTRTLPISVEIVENKKDDSTQKTEPNSSKTKELHVDPDESDDDDDVVEFSVSECNEESCNYIVSQHDKTKEIAPTKLKDNFTMEICLEDETVRLKLTPFNLVLGQDTPTVEEIDYSYEETERAVESISAMERLYTPLKESYKSKCCEIFDSTLTSIDTPLKEPSPTRNTDASVTELVLQADSNKSEAKTRKRARSSSNESANSTKRNKPDADLLLKAANIQNIDIETVLTKLHGH